MKLTFTAVVPLRYNINIYAHINYRFLKSIFVIAPKLIIMRVARFKQYLLLNEDIQPVVSVSCDILLINALACDNEAVENYGLITSVKATLALL